MGRFTNNHSIPGPPPQLCRQLRQHLGRGECAGLEASIVVWYALLIPIQVQIDPVMAQELKKLQDIQFDQGADCDCSGWH